MVVSDVILVICVAYFINYIMFYRRFRFFGNIIFIAISIALQYTGGTVAEKMIGMIFMLGFIINLFIDVFLNNKNSKRKTLTTTW